MLYEYYCSGCKRRIERNVAIADRHNQTCECGMPLKKLIHRVSVHIFDSYWDDMMDVNPVYIESEEQKKQELEKRGLQPRE